MPRKERELKDLWRAALLLPLLCLALAPLLLALGGPLRAQAQEDPLPEDEPEPIAAPEPVTQEFAYAVQILPAGEDELPPDLTELLDQVSQLRALQERPPQSQAGLERRIQNDLDLLDEALRSEGYYAAKLDWRIEPGPPLQVTITVETGPRFVMGDFAVEFPPQADLSGLPKPNLDEVGIRLGEPARAAEVLAAQRRMIDFLKDNGFPDARLLDTRVAVELTTAEMQVTLSLDPGQPATFGPLEVRGLQRLEEDYLRRRLQWPAGERYSAARLEQMRRDLVALNLFDSVALETGARTADGALPTTLKVVERPPRTIGIGASYTTSFGEGVAGGFAIDGLWEHRNLLGEAEVFRVEGTVGLVFQELEASFRKPDFLELQQTLVLSTGFRHEDSDAFKEMSFQVYGGIERPLLKHLTFAGGLGFEILRVDDLDPDDNRGAENFVLASLPLGLIWDDRADPLNPRDGVRAQLLVTPTQPFLASTSTYVTTEVTAATYYAPFEDDTLVLAVRGRFGSIVGGSLESVPASKRFYAGGGQSVRGYELRSLGPLDADDDPTGGLSVLELGFEVRTRFWDDYGLVAFVEGGQVYEDTLPDFAATPLIGAGIGLRYFTEFGPIRLDIATPLNGRDRDAAVQFYVSIGQAF